MTRDFTKRRRRKFHLHVREIQALKLLTFNSNQTHPQIAHPQTPPQADQLQLPAPNRDTPDPQIRDHLTPRHPQPLQINRPRDRHRGEIRQIRRIGQIHLNQKPAIRD